MSAGLAQGGPGQLARRPLSAPPVLVPRLILPGRGRRDGGGFGAGFSTTDSGGAGAGAGLGAAPLFRAAAAGAEQRLRPREPLPSPGAALPSLPAARPPGTWRGRGGEGGRGAGPAEQGAE